MSHLFYEGNFKIACTFLENTQYLFQLFILILNPERVTEQLQLSLDILLMYDHYYYYF